MSQETIDGPPNIALNIVAIVYCAIVGDVRPNKEYFSSIPVGDTEPLHIMSYIVLNHAT
jgi:hypothetical protein